MSANAARSGRVRPAYNCATRPASVDMEDWLKAGHCADPESGIQFCAIATGTVKRATARIDLIVDGRCLEFVGRRLSPMDDDSIVPGSVA